jgi:hypothetical protein
MNIIRTAAAAPLAIQEPSKIYCPAVTASPFSFVCSHFSSSQGPQIVRIKGIREK